MNKSNNPTVLDEESLKSLLQDILQKIREEGSYEELDAFRKVFKKTIPLFMRSYVAAYLLRSGTPALSKGLPRKKPSGPMSTLFISIGKNRKVFPRDLVLILSTTGKLGKSEIGDIKILDNYSFVEVTEDSAAPAIQRLDGISFRGKRLVVNFAKKKEESTRAETPRTPDYTPSYDEEVIETTDSE